MCLDGSAQTWRKYTREVSWRIRATQVNCRCSCATKLVERLTGPARMLAIAGPGTRLVEFASISIDWHAVLWFGSPCRMLQRSALSTLGFAADKVNR